MDAVFPILSIFRQLKFSITRRRYALITGFIFLQS